MPIATLTSLSVADTNRASLPSGITNPKSKNAFPSGSGAFEPLSAWRGLGSGKRNFEARDKGAEMAVGIHLAARRDHAPAGKPANSGLFAKSRVISVRRRLRGGAERTRTACQARSRYRNRSPSLPPIAGAGISRGYGGSVPGPNLHRCRYAAALSSLNLLRSNVALPGANIQKGLAFGRRRSGTDQQPRALPVAPADR
jgi:hypothetical protein